MSGKDEALKILNDTMHDLCVAMQSAYIEWQHGKGAEAAMVWIANTLNGPGLIPSSAAPHGKDAQAWNDANCSNPMPLCACGRPSHIGWMGKGFCSQEHYQAAYVASLN